MNQPLISLVFTFLTVHFRTLGPAPSTWLLAGLRIGSRAGYPDAMTTPVCPSYAGHRFPAEVISHAVWLYFRFPLSLRMVEEMLAARRIIVSHEGIVNLADFEAEFCNNLA